MLYLSRKLGESIIINNTVEVTVIEVRGKTVKLGFTFPPEVTVLRKEIYDKVMAENLAAAGSGVDEADFMDAMANLDALPKLPE